MIQGIVKHATIGQTGEAVRQRRRAAAFAPVPELGHRRLQVADPVAQRIYLILKLSLYPGRIAH